MLASIVALALPLLASASQLRFSPSSSSPLRVLSASSKVALADINARDDFVVLEHPHFKDHSIRIKEVSGWCDPDVSSYSGYLDVGYGKELYFSFFESRSEPSKDPLIMWINGGPGCSSAIGAFMELGPCSVVEDSPHNLTTKPNPYSWNNKANVFFLDSPVGVGFSVAKNGQVVGTTEDAAADVQAFIAIFLETFSEFKGRKLHMAGESYGGRYLPVFAAAVYDGNKALVAAGGTAINLASVMIGNGLTDVYSMIRGYYQHSCTNASGLSPLLSVGACQAMSLALPQCEEMIKAECIDRMDILGCENAQSFCQEHISAPFWQAGVNVTYDISKPCSMEELSDSLCYPITKKIGRYLDQPHVRALLGVSHRVSETFQSCSPTVGAAFGASHDIFGKTWFYVSSLLEHGVDVLVYVGKLDWICNSSGNYIWTNALEWTGGEDFSKLKLRDWTVDGKVAGQVRSHKGLTYMTVDGAGHMVPFDKPVESLQMVNHWLSGKDM